MLDQLTPDIKSVSPRPVALRYSLIYGAVTIVMALGFYLAGVDPQLPKTPAYIKWINGIIGLVLPVLFVWMALKEHKEKDLGGYLTVNRGMGMGALMGLFTGLITLGWMLLFGYLIAPDYFEVFIQQTMEQAAEQSGADLDAMEEGRKYMKMFINPIVFGIIGLVSSVFILFIIGLVVGAVIRKDPPATA